MAVYRVAADCGIAAMLDQLPFTDPHLMAAQIAYGCGFDKFRAAALMQDLNAAALHHMIAGRDDVRPRLQRVAGLLGVA